MSRIISTRQVTAGACSWLYKHGARAMALEVGLNFGGVVGMAWTSKWVADIVAISGSNAYKTVRVIEVKGSQADLNREDLTGGKWTMPWRHAEPWLACPPTLDTDDVPPQWGILHVHENRVKKIRAPLNRDLEKWQRYENVKSAWMTIAQTHTLQRLPRYLTSKSGAEALAALERGEFTRPWSLWAQRPLPEEDANEEEGGIL